MTLFALSNGCLGMKEELFFKDLGARIAVARKAQNLTQTDLAEFLGVAQQTLAHYEGGRLRLPVSMLPILAQQLGMTVEELLGQHAEKRGSKRGPTPRLQQQIDRISLLPKPKQRFVMEMLDTVIAQASMAADAVQPRAGRMTR
ncbi:MAG: helix-turn-helix domain-containing protein [Burkholderiales bacterium]|jgi:transcriptional regulator with XRE-family HTH domain